MLKVGIVGGTGKLGREVVSALLECKESTVGAVIARKGNPMVGSDIGSLVGRPNVHLTVTDDLMESSGNCDLYIDCTSAEAFTENYDAYFAVNKPIIVATTGFDESTQENIRRLSGYVPIVLCPNFSIGVYRFLKLVRYAVREFGSSMDIEIMDYHHKQKKDKPSGTAFQIAQAIRKVQGECPDCPEEPIAIHSIRAGNLVGEHRVLFVNSENERFELSHQLASRDSFAQGVVTAIRWIHGKEKGLHGMDDIFS